MPNSTGNLGAGECFLALYGQLERYPWIPDSGIDADAFSLFYMYGNLLGWAVPGHQHSENHCALWGFEDAGGSWSDYLHPSRMQDLLWVQLGLTENGAAEGLPLAQICHCADRVMSRAGSYTLDGLQLMTPLAVVDKRWPTSIRHVIDTANPADRCDVLIEVDSGVGSHLVRHADEILEEFSRAASTDGLSIESTLSVHESGEPLIAEPSALDRVAWLGESGGRILMRATTPEFTVDLGSHLIAHIARASSLAGVSGAMSISLARSSVVDQAGHG